ncbi:hypothetical protein [Kineosporia babensis]|uniref:Fibronectin type-III domain-containing protein n=1 Tax=Kineosporia babensis TaxID=499548 RepID=A0A9X1N6P1_9ACTN|nr:hypothetical protein [Kineosporia babensis]MCD5309332.1 hypothetical protein [Kineosporia babensis]
MSFSLRGIRRQSALITMAAAAFVLISPIEAQAAFQSSAGAATTVGTATLNPVSGATVSTSKCGTILTAAYLTVSWTATPSTFATGYTVTPLLNGSALSAISVPSRTTTTVDVPVIRGLLATYPYTFRIQAVAGNWTSTTVTTSPAYNCPAVA